MNKSKIYISGIIVIILISFFIILNARKNPTNIINSYSFIPRGRNSFVYIKDFQNARKLFDKTDFSKRLKDNYIYQDFKYKYSQDVDLFFVKYNMNIEKLMDIIDQDLVVGKNNFDYYLAVSVNFKSKLIYSILNILPEQAIRELKYRNTTINYVNKGKGTIYYTLLEDYLLFASETNIIQSMIDSYLDKEKNYKEDLFNICTNDDVYISSELDDNYNKYRLLPEIADVSLKVDLKNLNTKLSAEPYENSIFNNSSSIKDMSALKYFDKDFGLIYYNGVFDFQNQVSTLVNNYRVEGDDKEKTDKKREAQSNLDVFDKIDDGVFFALNDFKMIKGRNSILPEVCTIIRLKDSLSDKDKNDAANKIVNVFEFLFDIDSWRKESKKYDRYKDQYSGLSIIKNDNLIFFVYGESFSDNIVKIIEKGQSSLYDKYYDKIKNNNFSYFICLNPESVSDSIEPIFQEYMNAKLNLNKEEYKNSFGQLFGYLKEQNSLFLNLSFDKNAGILKGNIEYVK